MKNYKNVDEFLDKDILSFKYYDGFPYDMQFTNVEAKPCIYDKCAIKRYINGHSIYDKKI